MIVNEHFIQFRYFALPEVFDPKVDFEHNQWRTHGFVLFSIQRLNMSVFSRIEFILASALVSTVASQQVVGLIPSLVATPASSHRPKMCTLATPANSACSQVWTLICDEPAYQRASIAPPTVQHKWCQKMCTLLSKNVLLFFCLFVWFLVETYYEKMKGDCPSRRVREGKSGILTDIGAERDGV